MDCRASTAIAVVLKLAEECDPYEKLVYLSHKLFGKEYDTALQMSGFQTHDEFDSAILEWMSGPPEVRSWRELHADASETVRNASSGSRHKTTQPDFDFIQDGGAIISSFRQVYHLSVDETCDLHWWEFLELFRNIPSEGNAFGCIRALRNRKPDPKATPEQKDALRKAKRAVALKDTRSPERKEQDRQAMFNALEL